MTMSTFWWRALMPGLLLITATLPNRSSSFLNCIDIDSRSPDLECSGTEKCPLRQIPVFRTAATTSSSGSDCPKLTSLR